MFIGCIALSEQKIIPHFPLRTSYFIFRSPFEGLGGFTAFDVPKQSAVVH